jgi:uncharacterized protein YbaR (Trm112 family)
MALDPRLLDILRCPITGQALRMASRRQLEAANRAIAEGTARLAQGDRLTTPMSASLVTIEGRHFYRIETGIPVLLASESILLPSMPEDPPHARG